MSQRKTIGGNRLGSGKKMTVELDAYQRSSHDLGYIWRSSMAPGTLVPFLVEQALPGDTFDITLNANVMTHPTLGPLFGSFKLQLDVFEAPIRLYHSALMQNTVRIGNNMGSVLLPSIDITVPHNTWGTVGNSTVDPDNAQVNSSALLSYLGIRGYGTNNNATLDIHRLFNAIPLLAYWEIYKNYYANQQELHGALLQYTTPSPETIVGVQADYASGTFDIIQGGTTAPGVPITNGTSITISYTAPAPYLSQIVFQTSLGAITADNLMAWTDGGTDYIGAYIGTNVTIYGWNYSSGTDIPEIQTFDLNQIDDMKTLIMQSPPTSRFTIDHSFLPPYAICVNPLATPSTQNGLGLKTYQSDVFNNWMQTEWYTQILSASTVDTSSGGFTVDSLILARKVYDLLNRIAISGGTYQDWINAAYSHEHLSACNSPVYHGGLSKEVIFQEVVSNSQNANGNQPLGTLAGKGSMAKKHKGGKIIIKVNEPSYIIGIVSLTPRLDYSQGNRWFTGLSTMDDLHKPGLDQIGFQDLITEQMAWWDTECAAPGDPWIQYSAGYQPAWTNYMTNYNRCYGNFAEPNNEMFMTLNRRYQMNGNTYHIDDVTTYIDPSKYNFIFAQTSLDSQNFWTQIAVDITARRKMSAKVMPNL